MPLQPQGGGSGISTPAALTKFIRDAVLREPPRPVAAQSFGTLTAADAVNTPTLVVGGVAQPKITTRSLSLGPPPNPNDADIWIARDVDANGTRWQFQFNAKSQSAYKWEFIGGSPAWANVETAETTTSGTYTDLATVGPSITIARAGDYFTQHSADMFNAGGTAGWGAIMSISVGGATPSDADALFQVVPGSIQANLNFGGKINRYTGVAANSVIKAQYRFASGGTANFAYRRLLVTPIRIS